MKFVTFYTESYTHWMQRCVDSFKPWIEVIPIPMHDRQYWDYTCMLKPEMLYKELLKEDRPICMLDADLKCLREPTALLTYAHIAADHTQRGIRPFWEIICHDRGPLEKPACRYSGGVVAINNTAIGKQLVATWIQHCKHNNAGFAAKYPEQLYLHQAITELQPKLENFGVNYNYTVPWDASSDFKIPSEVLILHGDSSGPAHRHTRFK